MTIFVFDLAYLKQLSITFRHNDTHVSYWTKHRRDSSHFQIYEQKNETFETCQRVDDYATFLSTYGVNKSTKQQNMMKANQRLRSSALLKFCIAASATIVSVVNAQNPICYLCNGDPDAIFLFPDVVITVPDGSSTGGVTSATCAQIFNAGIAQLITAEQCAQAQASNAPNLQTTCGCSNIEGITAAPGGSVPTVPTPVALPAPPPVALPVTPPTVTPPTPPPVALPVSAPAVLAPVSTPAPILSPTVTPSNFPSVVPSDFLSDFPSYITSDTPSDIITDPPVQFETTAPTLTPTSSPSNRPSRNPSSEPTISCPEAKGKMSKGGMMMMGGKKEKGMMGKESKKGEEDEYDDEEDDVECPDRSKSSKGMMKEKDKEDKVSKGKGKESKGSKGMGMGEDESKGSGMVETKDRTEAKEGKKESKRLRYQL
jgi:hypothetical protein